MSLVIPAQADCVQMTLRSTGAQPRDCWSQDLSSVILLGGFFPFILNATSHLAIRADEPLCIHFTRLRSAL